MPVAQIVDGKFIRAERQHRLGAAHLKKCVVEHEIGRRAGDADRIVRRIVAENLIGAAARSIPNEHVRAVAAVKFIRRRLHIAFAVGKITAVKSRAAAARAQHVRLRVADDVYRAAVILGVDFLDRRRVIRPQIDYADIGGGAADGHRRLARVVADALRELNARPIKFFAFFIDEADDVLRIVERKFLFVERRNELRAVPFDGVGVDRIGGAALDHNVIALIAVEIVNDIGAVARRVDKHISRIDRRAVKFVRRRFAADTLAAVERRAVIARAEHVCERVADNRNRIFVIGNLDFFYERRNFAGINRRILFELAALADGKHRLLRIGVRNALGQIDPRLVKFVAVFVDDTNLAVVILERKFLFADGEDEPCGADVYLRRIKIALEQNVIALPAVETVNDIGSIARRVDKHIGAHAAVHLIGVSLLRLTAVERRAVIARVKHIRIGVADQIDRAARRPAV